MKKISFFMLTGAFLLSSGLLSAQCKLKSGSVDVLKGQTSLNLQYDYSSMSVGKSKSEEDYVATKSAEMNKKKDGSGDEWAGKWRGDRESRFQPVFERSLNRITERWKLSAIENAPDAKYTLIVHTTFTEPGFNAVVMSVRKNAAVTLEISLVETANPKNVLAVIEMKNVQSSAPWGYDYDTGGRIESAYDRAGGELGSFLAKNALK